ncbi:MAG TPA: hypothetical protein VFB62_02515 [Polyangiaceae bacterium]|nr:hypothetical protein [Polyangiaceae bacterium]
MLSLLWLGACAPIEARVSEAFEVATLDKGIMDVVNYVGPPHGRSTGLRRPPARILLRGSVPADLAGSWDSNTSMSWSTLVIDAHGRFIWNSYGCMGRTYWLGAARRDGDVLMLAPDKPDWAFGGGRLLDIVKDEEGIALVPRPRSKDDLSNRYPLRRNEN